MMKQLINWQRNFLTGDKLPAIDSFIASTVIVYNLTLVTRNTDDFKNTGISIFNPWNG